MGCWHLLQDTVVLNFIDGLPTLFAQFCRAIRPTTFRVPYPLPADKFVQMGYARRTLRRSDYLRALISCTSTTMALLLIFGGKTVVDGIRHECLLALAAREFAVCSLPALSSFDLNCTNARYLEGLRPVIQLSVLRPELWGRRETGSIGPHLRYRK